MKELDKMKEVDTSEDDLKPSSFIPLVSAESTIVRTLISR